MDKRPEKPDRCPNCKGKDFWWREGWGKPEWLCKTCHPPGLDKDNRSVIGVAGDS